MLPRIITALGRRILLDKTHETATDDSAAVMPRIENPKPETSAWKEGAQHLIHYQSGL